MDISKAALPPIQPHISAADRAHPRFPEYANYRAGMSRLLVEASSFKDWLRGQERAAEMVQWENHPQLRAFQIWMRDNKGGAPERNPAAFPENFKRWMAGERW